MDLCKQNNRPGLQALSPFPTLHLPPSRSDASVTPSVAWRVHTRCQPIDFLGAHLWLQSSGRPTSGWRTTWGLFESMFFLLFFFKRLPCWQNNCFVTQLWLLAVCICWTALSSQTLTAAGLWFSVFVWLLCHGRDCWAVTEAKDPEIHVDVSLDFSLNNISSNQLSHRFTFAGCFPVQRCCAAFSFYCDKVKIAKKMKDSGSKSKY